MNAIDLKKEASIVTTLSDCIDILSLLAESSFGNGTQYLLESLFYRLRHLAQYFYNGNEVRIDYKDNLSIREQSIMDKIIDIRNISAHPESDRRWLNEYVMVCCGMIFKNEDVEIQYGHHKLLLIKEVVLIYKKLRELFSQVPELSQLSRHHDWDRQEIDLANVEQKLINLLKCPDKLFKSGRSYEN